MMQDMPRDRDPFNFLSNEEFERLTIPQKLSYLERAFEAIKKLHEEVARHRSERRKKKRK
jgi:N-glycosylase/DNA lyase